MVFIHIEFAFSASYSNEFHTGTWANAWLAINLRLSTNILLAWCLFCTTGTGRANFYSFVCLHKKLLGNWLDLLFSFTFSIHVIQLILFIFATNEDFSFRRQKNWRIYRPGFVWFLVYLQIGEILAQQDEFSTISWSRLLICKVRNEHNHVLNFYNSFKSWSAVSPNWRLKLRFYSIFENKYNKFEFFSKKTKNGRFWNKNGGRK